MAMKNKRMPRRLKIFAFFAMLAVLLFAVSGCIRPDPVDGDTMDANPTLLQFATATPVPEGLTGEETDVNGTSAPEVVVPTPTATVTVACRRNHRITNGLRFGVGDGDYIAAPGRYGQSRELTATATEKFRILYGQCGRNIRRGDGKGGPSIPEPQRPIGGRHCRPVDVEAARVRHGEKGGDRVAYAKTDRKAHAYADKQRAARRVYGDQGEKHAATPERPGLLFRKR